MEIVDKNYSILKNALSVGGHNGGPYISKTDFHKLKIAL
jgi:hypothetical protein